VETPSGTFAISSQRYRPDVIHPDGGSRIEYQGKPRLDTSGDAYTNALAVFASFALPAR
jgi:hypothetical protein